jgi:hypothetical protein
MEKKVDSYLRCDFNEETTQTSSKISDCFAECEVRSQPSCIKNQRQMLLSNLQLSLKIKEIKEKVRIAKMIEDIYLESLREIEEESLPCASFQDHFDYTDTSIECPFSHPNIKCPSHITSTTQGSSDPDISSKSYFTFDLSQNYLENPQINNRFLKFHADSRKKIFFEKELGVLPSHNIIDDQESMTSLMSCCVDDSEKTELMVDFYTDEDDLLVDFPSVRSMPNESTQTPRPSGNLLVPFKNLQG